MLDHILQKQIDNTYRGGGDMTITPEQRTYARLAGIMFLLNYVLQPRNARLPPRSCTRAMSRFACSSTPMRTSLVGGRSFSRADAARRAGGEPGDDRHVGRGSGASPRRRSALRCHVEKVHLSKDDATA